jgi:hypothetical protein
MVHHHIMWLEKDSMRKGERESPIDSQASYPVIQSMGYVHSKMVQQSYPGLYLSFLSSPA